MNLELKTWMSKPFMSRSWENGIRKYLYTATVGRVLARILKLSVQPVITEILQVQIYWLRYFQVPDQQITTNDTYYAESCQCIHNPGQATGLNMSLALQAPFYTLTSLG